MSAFDQYFFGRVAAARPYLLLQGFLLLLAFDCFIDLTPHGGRYGMGEFNVAHFGLLDALAPLPTPAVYVGTILACGMLAITIAFAPRSRVVLGALAALYTWSWAMSQLDSYQHHYLLSIVFIAFVFYPRTSAVDLVATEPDPGAAERAAESRAASSTRQKRRRKAKRARDGGSHAGAGPYRGAVARDVRLPGFAWAYHATAVSFAIVYAYTALSKSEQDWRSGHALQRIAPHGMHPIREFFVVSHGMESDTFWWLVGHSVVVLQLVIAAGYLAAPLLDRGRTWVKALCLVAFVGATSFHIGAEYLDLKIGWFSYYMLIAACVFFLPASAIDAFARAVTWPLRTVVEAAKPKEPKELDKSPPTDSLSQVAPLALGAALIIGLASYIVDLPGALAVGAFFAVALVAGVFYAASRRRAGEARSWITASALAALAMWASIVSTDVRYEYYRFVGGDMRRRGDLEAALEAYVKANRYASGDEDRHRQEDQVRRELGLESRWE